MQYLISQSHGSKWLHACGQLAEGLKSVFHKLLLIYWNLHHVAKTSRLHRESPHRQHTHTQKMNYSGKISPVVIDGVI